MEKIKRLSKLFFNMVYISSFTFGGGFVIVSIMKKKFVDELHWIEEDEMLDYVAISQSSPGAIAVNCAILVGTKIGGFPGMLTAVAGTILPPIVILSVIAMFYKAFAENTYVNMMLRGMSAGVAAVVIDVAVSLCIKETSKKNVLNIILMAAAFIAAFVFKINVIYIIIVAAVIGLVGALINRKEKKNVID